MHFLLVHFYLIDSRCKSANMVEEGGVKLSNHGSLNSLT